MLATCKLHTRSLLSFSKTSLPKLRWLFIIFLLVVSLSLGFFGVKGEAQRASHWLKNSLGLTKATLKFAESGMWVHLSGPVAQRIRSLAAHDQFIFAGSFGSGVYRSNDNGTTWQQVNSGLTATDVRALLSNDSQLLAGTNTGGVFVTTNNGNSWSASNSGLPSVTVTALAKNGIHLFAGTGRGVALSTNNGASWTPVINGTGNVEVLSLTVSNGAVYAGTASSGIYKSLDNGASWTSASSGLPSQAPIRSLTAASNGYLYAGPGNQGVYRSTDSGASWTAVNTGLTEYFVYSLETKGNSLFAGTENSRVFSLQFCAPI